MQIIVNPVMDQMTDKSVSIYFFALHRRQPLTCTLRNQREPSIHKGVNNKRSDIIRDIY